MKPLGALWLLIVAGAGLLAPGCARSLHEPPALSNLGGGGVGHVPGDVENLLAEAHLLYADRTLESVRKALGVWLDAARADDRREEGLVGAARAAVWLAGHESDRAIRLDDAALAVQAAQWCGRIAPKSAACSFWLGASLGTQADVKRSTALDALPRIVEAFQTAAAADPNVEDAGPDRALALLYARAPNWPAGPGDPDLALEHALKAVTLRPDFPPNRLALAEAQVATGAKAAGRETYEMALSLAREWAAHDDPDALEWIQEAEEALSHLAGGGGKAKAGPADTP